MDKKELTFTAKDNGVSIKTVLENYRFVEGAIVDDECVRVYLEDGCKFYDSDSVIGLLVRRFDLEYVEEKESELDGKSYLNFKRLD